MTLFSWMIYSVLVGTALTLAALCVEYALTLYRRPVRGIWVAAIGGSLALPAGARLLPHWSVPGTDGLSSAMGGALHGWQALEISVNGGSLAGDSGMDPALAVWLACSLAFAGLLAWNYRRLRAASRGWEARELCGREVQVSTDTGPGVFGWTGGEIVVPRWLLYLDREVQRLVLAHEAEHVRARDPHLLIFALAALVVMPWNPALWWQVRRLRLAVELDCDRRLLRSGIDAGRYAGALIEVGRRRSRAVLAAPGFSVGPTAIERRIRSLFKSPSRGRGLRAGLATVMAMGLVVAACESASDSPSAELSISEASELQKEMLPRPPDDSDQLGQEPVFTPFTKQPELVDRRAAVRTVERSYPDELKANGVSGTVIVWVFIDAEGRVRNSKVNESSGRAALDRAAQEAVRNFEFEPALQEGEPVPVWISVPITYQAGHGEDRSPS